MDYILFYLYVYPSVIGELFDYLYLFCGVKEKIGVKELVLLEHRDTGARRFFN